MNLSLDGIHRDESGFLNGSRTAHCESLKRLRCESPFFSGAASKLSFPPQVSQVTLFTRQKLFYFRGGGVEESEQRASPSHWGDRWREGRLRGNHLGTFSSTWTLPSIFNILLRLREKRSDCSFSAHSSVSNSYVSFKTQWYFLRVQKIEL